MLSIRILESEANACGDLFGRLMADLFVALGYEYPRLNVHKSGRELDLSAAHRFEDRRAIAECKATQDPIGGSDVNKFVGALDAEHEDGEPVAGYFVSLSGFRETAIEQERKRKRTPITLLTGRQVIEELVRGRCIVPFERAAELGGRMCPNRNALVLDSSADLLASSKGWIWCLYWTDGKMRTHFALIHGDGTPVSRTLAMVIIENDRNCGGSLETLDCMNPGSGGSGFSPTQLSNAISAYAKSLAEECGYILLDGMPIDGDVGSRRLRLENLFVPLHLDIRSKDRLRVPVGEVLEQSPQLALLAPPGGGKSTLIKRLAVAYADPNRIDDVADGLPQRGWQPLFFRCRDLRDSARGSFADLILAISQRETVRQHADAFRAVVDAALQDGKALLLVDGLDEIADAGDRAAFVCTIRSTVLAYPGTGLVATSREAGFRHVAAHLAPVCTRASLSPFDSNDIASLSVAWHREVVGDTDKVRTDAEHLASTIVENDRIRSLAENPLLLTTLLLVKRWVGSLPTRRAVLYGKAVEVLLMTWNTEGHDPLLEEEALPQLCYVASAMMLEKVERISRPSLAKLLQQAREAMPTELGYVQGSVEDFIHRVEDRSSLLMMTGLDVEDGRLVEFYEFRHLTFQEFLAARAVVEGWHPGRQPTETLADILEHHFDDEKWRETIPLAAALGGKATEALLGRLTSTLARLDGESLKTTVVYVLASCLADEAAASRGTVRAAARELVRVGSKLFQLRCTPQLARSKYSADLREEARNALVEAEDDIANAADALLALTYFHLVRHHKPEDYLHAASRSLEMLNSEDRLARFEGANCLGKIAYDLLQKRPNAESAVSQLCAATAILEQMLFDGTVLEVCTATYSLPPIMAAGVWQPSDASRISGRFVDLWLNHGNGTLRRLAARAFVTQPLQERGREDMCGCVTKEQFERFWDEYSELGIREQPATLVLAYYRGTVEDDELARRVKRFVARHGSAGTMTLSSMLARLTTDDVDIGQLVPESDEVERGVELAAAADEVASASLRRPRD